MILITLTVAILSVFESLCMTSPSFLGGLDIEISGFVRDVRRHQTAYAYILGFVGVLFCGNLPLTSIALADFSTFITMIRGDCWWRPVSGLSSVSQADQHKVRSSRSWSAAWSGGSLGDGHRVTDGTVLPWRRRLRDPATSDRGSVRHSAWLSGTSRLWLCAVVGQVWSSYLH